MAERCAIAFGRYLRMLRERKGLSLEDVSSLSKTFVDPLHKSYLSRAENGRHRLALSKLAPVSRIYEVPPEVILERLELDMELDKVGAPDTAGLNYADLTLQAKSAFDRGAVWDSYAFFRDATVVAASSPLLGRLRDQTEQVLCASMNFGTAAINLGRFRLAIHELSYIQSVGELSERLFPLLLDRLSRAYRSVDDLDKARAHADEAIKAGRASGTSEYLGFLYGSRALIAARDGDVARAMGLEREAFDAFRAAGQDVECARSLLNLANFYVSAKRLRSARRALVSADRLAKALSQERIRALVRIVLGKIEIAEGSGREATIHWREASTIAKRLNDKSLRFKSELLLYEQAVAGADELAASSIERRLRRLAAWLSGHEDEVRRFRELLSQQPPKRRKRVAASQLARKSDRNPRSA